ncbi:MAG: aldolase/citrate lyase family protein [Bryobacteraceae bacterium]
MKKNRFQEVLKAGAMPIGHMIMEFGTRGIPRILDSTGLDFVLFDMEHSGIDNDRIADILAGCYGTSFAPFVRVPSSLYHFIARVLDAGALGIMVANVETAQQARDIVSHAKYPPQGHRGLGLGTAHNDYTMPDPPVYLKEANDATTIICQIESSLGVSNCEEIAAVPGVDVLWVGHFDLSASMGIVNQFQHPAFLAAMKRVSEAAKANGKAAGIQPGNWDQAQHWAALGYNVLSWQSDIALYRGALQAAVTKLATFRDR